MLPAAQGQKLAGPDMGAADLFGHELGAAMQLGKILAPHQVEIAPAQPLVAEATHQLRRAVGEVDRTEQAELGLGEEVVEDVLGDGRHRLGPAQHAAAMAHGVDAESPEGDLLHRAIGRMMLDPLLVAAIAVARMQDGGMTLGHLGEIVQLRARQRAQLGEMRREVVDQRRGHVEWQQFAQAPVDVVVVQAAAGRRQCR